MAKKLMKGQRSDWQRRPSRPAADTSLGIPITPQNEVPGIHEPHACRKVGRLLSTGGERSGGHQHGLWRGGRRRPRDDLLFQPGDQPEAGGDQLYRLRGASVRDRQHDASCGPGLGGIQPAQGDYFQATKGGGHGDYHLVVLAPSTVQEAADMVMEGV